MKVILDANVVVAAFASRGLCESIFELCLDRYEIILSEHLLGEISRSLIKKIKLPKEGVDEIIELLRENATILSPDSIPPDTCRDSDDVKVLGLATAAGADCIVTGDKDLLVLIKFRSIPILTPRDFSEIIHKR
jgi:putative PIN family toxin of toxin-antitoxin system